MTAHDTLDHAPDRTTLPAEALVDAETGIIRSVREVPHPVGAPHRYLALTASVADARMLGEWPADRVSLGTSFGDPAQARIAAIGEGVERYCGNWLPDVLPRDELRVATAQELRAGPGEKRASSEPAQTYRPPG